MEKKFKILFFAILSLAAFLRFYQIGNIPSSLNWDEISHGYNAYSILNTGKDQWGEKFPIFNFRAYGDYPTALNLYLTIPFIKLFGLNAFAIRLPHALLSLLTVTISFFLVQTIFHKKLLSFLTMLLFAISPWLIFPGRGVFQSNLSLFLFTTALWLFYLSFKRHNCLFISAIMFGLSLYSYHNTRILIPIFVPVLIILYLRQLLVINKKILLFSLLLFLTFALPNFIALFSPESQSRNRWVGIINPNSINLINESRRLFTGPEFLNRIINNKVIYFSKQFSLNYLDLINPFPIFFNGSENYQFNPPRSPLIFSIFLPFFYLGLFIAFKKYSSLLILFLICLLPAALTIGDFPSIRASIALPFYLIFISLGLLSLKSKLIYLVIFISFFQLTTYISTYLHYNQSFSSAWQYGYQQAVETIKPIYSQYNQIIFTKKYGEPHEFILFYWPWNPDNYLSDKNLNWDYHSDWYWVNSFDKFKFVNDWEIKNLKFSSKTLLVTSPNNFSNLRSTKLTTINFLDGSPAFDIISYEP